MSEAPTIGECELVDLKDALLKPVRDLTAWVRHAYIDAPVGSDDPGVVALVRDLRRRVFNRLIERLTP